MAGMLRFDLTPQFGKAAASLAAATLLLLASGCATDSAATRRQDHWMAYSALPQEQRELVDQGRIRAGMNTDAVLIAWGKAAEVADAGSDQVIWRYAPPGKRGGFREIRQGIQPALERAKSGGDAPGAYARAEVVFRQGRVTGWRLLPGPAN